MRRFSRSSSRSTYGIGRPWFVRLEAYASKADKSSARAIDEEELAAAECLWVATTLRAWTTLFHKSMGSSRRVGAGMSGADIATAFLLVQDVSG